MSKLFGGKDPFDDPFFTQQFGSKKEIIIEEVDNDGKSSVPNTEEAVSKTSVHNADEGKSFSFRRVAYGGINGVYYSSSIGQRRSNDGVFLLEIQEEDKTIGEALHTISRGIHEKGHTLTKKRNPNGKEDSLQILHNLNEDELSGFEENWKVNADRHIPGWNDGFNSLANAGISSHIHLSPRNPLVDHLGMNVFGELGWKDDGGWRLPWTDPNGAMVATGEGEGSASSKKVIPVDIM